MDYYLYIKIIPYICDVKLYIITIYYQEKNGYIRAMVGWMSGLVGGLQNHIPRFESGTDLIFAILFWGDNQ